MECFDFFEQLNCMSFDFSKITTFCKVLQALNVCKAKCLDDLDKILNDKKIIVGNFLRKAEGNWIKRGHEEEK